MKLWTDNDGLNRLVEEFTVGNDPELDLKLVRYDCIGSIAHARTLHKAGILTKDEEGALVAELEAIMGLVEKGEFRISREQEDCHTAIEDHLTDKLGDAGKKLHTARSRNDQVLTALRLYYKEQLAGCRTTVETLIQRLSAFVDRFGTVALPGYTHTRKAMPSSVAMWGAAFIESMQDNLRVLDLAHELIDQSPAGTGAGYGVPIPIDRDFAARQLQFSRVQNSPVYAQLSRGKFESTILHALGLVLFDLNRMASDLILFSLPDIGFFQLPPELCTGSSIMPQKMNPDVLELMRASYHALAGYEQQVRATVANLITGYHRDFQLTKEPTMRGFETAFRTLEVACLVVEKLSVDPKRAKAGMTAELFATEEAYQLVREGIPFREAYRRISKKFKLDM